MTLPTPNSHLWLVNVDMVVPGRERLWTCIRCGSTLASASRPDRFSQIVKKVSGKMRSMSCYEVQVLDVHES